MCSSLTGIAGGDAPASSRNLIALSVFVIIGIVLVIVLAMYRAQRRLRREIELRHEIEEKLLNTNVLFERTSRLAKVGGWEFDFVNDRHTWTDEALRIRELTPGTVLSRDEALAFYAPEDRPVRLAEHEAAARDGTPWEHESLLTTMTGKQVWVHSRGEAIVEDGKVVKLVGAIQDITARKQAELSLLNRSRELEMHNRILRQINRGMPLEETLESMAWQIETLHPKMLCAIMLVEAEGGYLRCGTAPSLPDSFIEVINGMRIKQGAGGCGTSASLGELVVIDDLEHHPYFDEYRDIALMAGLRSCWSQPILEYGGKVLGTFTIYQRERIEPGDDEIVLLETYASLAGLVIERHRAEKQIRNLAFYDSLTQLPNRRMLDDRLALAMALSKRTGRHGAVMFLDLDNFKPLNDSHGHAVGDLLLIQVARRLTGCVRETDAVVRFGGDEFVVMLTELDVNHGESLRQTRYVAEKIRMALAEPYTLVTRQSGGGDQIIPHCCTASIGIELFVNHSLPLDDILRRADAAMYQAKDAGRNTIAFYQQVPDVRV